MLTTEDADRHADAYAAARSQYEQFTEAVAALLRSLLNAEELQYVSVSGRAKDTESYRGKIAREGKDYVDPLNEVTDLAGLRVVCYDLEAAGKVAELIQREFDIDAKNSIDKASQLDSDQFGYLSVHYVVRLKTPRDTLPEYRRFAGLRGEIQVRTALQDTWASLDHSLRYKAKTDVPAGIQRPLYRISALLEMADEEFRRLKRDARDLQLAYVEGVAGGQIDKVEVNSDSVDAFLKAKKKYIVELSASADSAGFALMPKPPTQKTPWTNLVRTLQAAELNTLREFEAALDKFLPASGAAFKSVAARWKQETNSPRVTFDPSTLLRLSLLFAIPPARGLELAQRIPFGPALKKVVENELRARMKETSG